MGAEVKLEVTNCFYLTVSDVKTAFDLHKAFEELISKENCIERKWQLSRPFRSEQHPIPRGDIEWGNWEFEISNIPPAEVTHFNEILLGFCQNMGLQLKSEIKQ